MDPIMQQAISKWIREARDITQRIVMDNFKYNEIQDEDAMRLQVVMGVLCDMHGIATDEDGEQQ